MRSPVNQVAPLLALVLLSACGAGTGERGGLLVPAPARNGPAADYPVVIGEPFDVGGVIYTPADRMNFDSVGYASIGNEGGQGVSAAHKTLPLPSYVEVTALDSGKTILVRVERRGPMSNDRLVELSPGAASQLGIAGNKAPVRVRRVNPPEPERALLRSGQRAPDRMDTPKPLLAVLLRKIAPNAPVLLSGGTATATAKPTPALKPSSNPATTPAIVAQPVIGPAIPKPTPKPAAAAPAPRAASGSLAIQVGAFASRANADATAAKVGGRVEPAGRLFRVRSGPFTTRAEADAALAKVRSAGYRDARIQPAN